MGNIELADFTSPRRGRSRQASRGAKKRGGGLNLCGSYAGLPESGGVNGGTVTSHLRCAPGGPSCGHTNCEDRSDASGGVGRITPMSEENLNVSSAMLHLVADVLRGVTILISAIVIEFFDVSDPGKADAVCALFVAGFILIGAVALFKRFYV